MVEKSQQKYYNKKASNFKVKDVHVKAGTHLAKYRISSRDCL